LEIENEKRKIKDGSTGCKAILSDSSACGRIEKENLPQREQSGTEVLIMDDYQNQVLECALAYIQRGWKVLPLYTVINGRCTCGKSDCSSPGKHPITPNGVKDASGDEADIRRWFSNGIAFNIGIATGSASGLVVLDIDPKNGGDISIQQFTIPPTLEVITGSGGRHYYFAIPEGVEIRNSAGKLAAGLDVRGEGGYVVAPPSIHISGNSYRWAVDPRGVKAAPWPKELRIENAKSLGDKLRIEDSPAAKLDNDIIPQGCRNDKLTSIAGAMRRKGCDQEAIFAALISINQRRCRPPLTYDELHKIAESIANYSPQPQEGSVLADDHHETIALAFEAASPQKHRHYAGTWVVLRHKKYFILDEQELDKDIRRFAADCKVRKKIRTENGSAWRNEKLRVTPQSVHGIIKAMAALDDVRLSLKVVSPSWLSETPLEDDDDTNFDPSAPLREPDNPVGRQHDKKPNPERVLPLKNCLLDVSGNEPKVMELTDDYFTLNYLPILYDPKAKCTKWKEFLGQIFQTKRLSSDKTEWTAEADDFVEVYENVPDELSISTLQEYVGLLLTPITKYQKILGIVGPKRSGKGTIGRIIRALVGKDNVASPTLIGLTNEHGLQGLYHKTVALVSDASISGGNADTLRAVERLKSITGEDSQQINPKCKAHFEVDRLRVRFVIMSNELQKLTDPTGAMASRFIYLITTQSFFGKEDVNLEGKLLAEIPGIFNWAVEGLIRLLKRDYFLETEAGREATAMAEELGSPVIEFVREWCEVGPSRQIRGQELYDAYKRWCEEAGRSKMGRTKFYEGLQRVVKDCSHSKVRQENSGTSPVWVFENIALLPEYRTTSI